MEPKERVIRAIEFSGPDRPPVMHWTLPGTYRVYGAQLEALYNRYPSDVLLSPVTHGPFALASKRMGMQAGLVEDEWGVCWHYLTGDFEGQPVSHPLADYRALDDYMFPDPLGGRQSAQAMVETVRADGHRHYVIAVVGNLWQQLHHIRGFENCMLDLADGRQEFLYLIDRVADYLLARINFWCQFEEVDGLHIGDDWGSQTSLMIAPAMWRRIFKPVYGRLVSAIHAGAKHAHFHTDGYTFDILSDLIEIGFDTLNPQVWCMDAARVGELYAGRVCFRGELDRQKILPFGTPAEVVQHVKQARAFFHTSAGGYIFYGQLGPDVPLANAEAMLKAFYEN
jgi:uroporphyrinogen-III decarboxylase